MTKYPEVGVVVMRVQNYVVHPGHIHLCDHVLERHERVIVYIGSNSVRFTPRNPYPFYIRKHFFGKLYPNVTIIELPDSKIDSRHWSKDLDARVAQDANGASAILYGSRDSFYAHYSGHLPYQHVEELPDISATDFRDSLRIEDCIDKPGFLEGWLCAIREQYPITDPTVDVAIHTTSFNRVLMGRRGKGSPLRFFGGFVDRKDESYEVAVKRECSEEATRILVGEPVYIGSRSVNDSRYWGSGYGVMTVLFAMVYKSGDPVAGDDMGEVEWCDLDESLYDQLAPEHKHLYRMLMDYKAKETSKPWFKVKLFFSKVNKFFLKAISIFQ